MKIEITKISTVRKRHGMDVTFLQTNLPSGIWPYEGLTQVKLDLARGHAEEYVKKNFPGVEHKIIEA